MGLDLQGLIGRAVEAQSDAPVADEILDGTAVATLTPDQFNSMSVEDEGAFEANLRERLLKVRQGKIGPLLSIDRESA